MPVFGYYNPCIFILFPISAPRSVLLVNKIGNEAFLIVFYASKGITNNTNTQKTKG